MKFIAALLLASGVAIVSLVAQSVDPWIGTWKVDLARSTYTPGPKPTAGATVKIEQAPGGAMKTTIDGVDPSGRPTHTETIGMFDRKDNAVTGAAVPNTTAAFSRIDERTFDAIGKVDGKPSVTTRVTVSADGKTLTATQTGTTSDGGAIRNVIVADRQ